MKTALIRVSLTMCCAALLGACGGEPKPGDIILANGREMIYVPGGVFTIGDSSIGLVEVKLKPYLIDKHEVTTAEFREFASLFRLPFPVPPSHDPLPVTNVKWQTADAFAAWRGCRLPTEAEWELAARGYERREFPWGEKWDPRRCNGDDDTETPGASNGAKDGFVRTAPVGLFPQGASPFGVEDMAGNVREWVNDWYAAYPDSADGYYRPPTDGVRKSVRGGSYRTSRLNLRTYHRTFLPPSLVAEDIGFRLACGYPPPKPGEVSLPEGADAVQVIEVQPDTLQPEAGQPAE